MTLVEMIQANPKISIILIAVAISLLISLVNNFVLDKDRMRSLKARQKAIQEEMKEHQKNGNQDKVMELQKEMMSGIGESFKHSFKPMLITIVPIIVLFGIVRNTFAETAIAGSWFWWYLLGAIVSSMIWRKVFRLP